VPPEAAAGYAVLSPVEEVDDARTDELGSSTFMT
jgi:hypothetical protein